MIASYRPEPIEPVIGRAIRWRVLLNGWKSISTHDSLDEAEREAARLNYAGNGYPRVRQIGLDGI